MNLVDFVMMKLYVLLKKLSEKLRFPRFLFSYSVTFPDGSTYYNDHAVIPALNEEHARERFHRYADYLLDTESIHILDIQRF